VEFEAVYQSDIGIALFAWLIQHATCSLVSGRIGFHH
jgi:hypothetical protein